MVIDVIALNETLLSKKHNFKNPGYNNIRNDRSSCQTGVAFLVKNGLVVNKEYWNIGMMITKPWQSILNLRTTKTSLWQPFTAQMEILTFHFFKLSRTYLIVSCLSETPIRN